MNYATTVKGDLKRNLACFSSFTRESRFLKVAGEEKEVAGSSFPETPFRRKSSF